MSDVNISGHAFWRDLSSEFSVSFLLRKDNFKDYILKIFQRALPVPTRREQGSGRGPRARTTREATTRPPARYQSRAR
jgi:hypothetical protein